LSPTMMHPALSSLYLHDALPIYPVESYILVRQSDAHAWAEIWSPDAGWVRIDPTNAVAPNRVEYGVEEALAEDERSLFENPWHQDRKSIRLNSSHVKSSYAVFCL